MKRIIAALAAGTLTIAPMALTHAADAAAKPAKNIVPKAEFKKVHKGSDANTD
jgi:hypothetical protein